MIEKFNTMYSTSVDGIHWEYHPNKDDILEKINELIDVVNAMEDKSAPTIEAEPIKHGHWIDGAICSVCGELATGLDERYCENCGAKMDEVEE